MRYFNNDLYSNEGSEIVIEYSPIVSDDGSIRLEESGKRNIQEEIDSFEESCDLNVIVGRYLNGDLEALNRKTPAFGDFTKMPKTYAEMLQLEIDSHKLYDSLPAEIKQKFDNDVNKFFVSSGTDEWYEKLGYVKQEEIKKEEIKEVAE